MLNVVIMGPPGAGKGTQAKRLADEFGFLHLSPGDLLRQAVKEGSGLGRKAKEYMDSGRLVPDDIIIDLIGSRIREEQTRAGGSAAAQAEGARRGVILDGFPRTLPQADALGGLLAELGQRLDVVVNVVLPEEEAIRRLTGRRVCRQCGANYHLLFKAPAREGLCDLCGGPLYQRSDDSEATARARFDVYRRETEPLIDYYAKRGLVEDVDGRGEVGDVARRLEKTLGLGR